MPVSIFPIKCGVKQVCNLPPTLFTFLCKQPSFGYVYKEFESGNNSWEPKLIFLPHYAAADDSLVC